MMAKLIEELRREQQVDFANGVMYVMRRECVNDDEDFPMHSLAN